MRRRGQTHGPAPDWAGVGVTGSVYRAPYTTLTLGSARFGAVSSVIAHTSASSRSGERPDASPSTPTSHIWSSSSAGGGSTRLTRPCEIIAPPRSAPPPLAALRGPVFRGPAPVALPNPAAPNPAP